MTDDPGDRGDTLRRARDVLRLQRSVLPGRAVQRLADEVVVRLASRLQPGTEPERIAAGLPVDDFCRALIVRDSGAAMQMIRQDRLEGVPVEQIYLGTLAVAAERLGLWWNEDRIGFLEMSVAAGRIFDIMRHLRQANRGAPNGFSPGREALFAAVPGELHTLGVTMAADLFRARGWDIDLRVGHDHEELMAAAAARNYRVIGLSAGGRAGILPLARCVVAFRITHPGAGIFISGSLVRDMPDIGALVGADGVAGDWPETVRLMTDLSGRA